MHAFRSGLGKYFTATLSFMCTIQETVSAEELSQLISELDVKMANYQVRIYLNNLRRVMLFRACFPSLYFIRSTILIVKWISFLFKRSRQRCQ